MDPRSSSSSPRCRGSSSSSSSSSSLWRRTLGRRLLLPVVVVAVTSSPSSSLSTTTTTNMMGRIIPTASVSGSGRSRLSRRLPMIRAVDALAAAGVPRRAPSSSSFAARGPTDRRPRCHRSSPSLELAAAVVPEVGGDYDDGGGGGGRRRRSPDRFPGGAEELWLEDAAPAAKEEEEANVVIDNPFPFPEPTFAYTETGTRSPAATVATGRGAFDPRPDGVAIGGTGGSAIGGEREEAEGPSEAAAADHPFDVFGTETTAAYAPPPIGGSGSGSVSRSNRNSTDAGTRTMVTLSKDDTAGADDDDFRSTAEERPSAQSASEAMNRHEEEEDRESRRTLDLEDRDPFASIPEDSGGGDDGGPVKPLVAPLKLSKPTENDVEAVGAAPATTAVPSIETNGLDDLVDSLRGRLASVEREIEIAAPPSTTTAGKKVNLNSPRQVSTLLFGRPDVSTNKEALEGMAGSSILAKLVLEYRSVRRKLNAVLKRQESRDASAATGGAGGSGSEAAPPRPPPRRALKDPVWLFDTSSFIYRAYYSTPPIHRGRDGMPIGAVMGFCSMLNKLLLSSMLRGETPTLVHCLDAPGPTFRNELYEGYKAHRPPIPLDLVPQFDLIHRAIRAYGMIQIQSTGYEADDVIATLATVASKREGLDVAILSGDKDLMQLITDEDGEIESEGDGEGVVRMVDPMTSEVWTHDTVVEKWGVPASKLGDLLALAGDAADNVPGVPGIGPKIAAKLLGDFGDLERLLERASTEVPQAKRRETLESNADLARLSRELVELDRNLPWSDLQAVFSSSSPENDDVDDGSVAATASPLPESTRVGDLRMRTFDADRILAFYDDMGFRKLKSQLLDRLEKREQLQQQQHPHYRSPRPRSTEGSSSVAAAAPRASSTTTRTATAKGRRGSGGGGRFGKKKTRGVPKPEDFEGVPF